MRPQHAAVRLEQHHHIAGAGVVERLVGYGLMGIAFESGDVVALRRCTASSIGPPYAALWHRDAQLRWTFYTNVEPARSCPRYFGPALHDVRVDDVEIGWNDAWQITAVVRRARVRLAVRLGATPSTRMLGVAAHFAPDALWRREAVRPLIAPIVAHLLGAGALVLAGRTPSEHNYLVRPRRVWRVGAAACVLNGRDPGAIVTPIEPPRVGEFLLPGRPLFGAGSVTLERP